MTPVLAGALVLSVLSGVTASALYLVWPRRLSAEEWIVHRRSYAVAAAAARAGSRPRAILGRRSAPIRWTGLTDADLAILAVAGQDLSADAAARQLLWLAAGGAIAGLVLASIAGIASGGSWLVVSAPVVGLIGAFTLAAIQLLTWRRRARALRIEVQRRLPRVLTGARVLLESGGATAEVALSAAVATYADPAANVLREALRAKEVRRVALEDAMDEVSDRYAIQAVRRLADNFRIGHRYGTGMSELLAGFARSARENWHADYRRRITRAPVLMTVPALIFFVLPLLVLVMYLVFTPLLGTLSRL